MKETLQPGLQFRFSYEVPVTRTVPHLLPESEEFQAMPEVLASGYMVGLIEWACIQAMNPHLDWPREQSVGVGLAVPRGRHAPRPHRHHPGGSRPWRGASSPSPSGPKTTWT